MFHGRLRQEQSTLQNKGVGVILISMAQHNSGALLPRDEDGNNL